MAIYFYRAALPATAASAVVLISLACPVAAFGAGDGAAAATPQTEAMKGESIHLESITVSAKSGAYRKEGKDTASGVAPTQSSLDATQPRSIITREFIENAVAPTAEYSRVVNIAPSVSGDSANGPGLPETKTTLRGFSDDQYNITFDGIPWGDTNNPAHHSTSFFPASVIGGAVVDRGPGTASNLGYATFGGSIHLFSKKPLDAPLASAFGSVGRWNTSLVGAAYESGRLADWDDAAAQLNYQHLQSDGYLTFNDIRSDNVALKVTRPVGGTSTLTAFSSVNRIKYTQPDNNKGPTLAQVAQFGRNFSLNEDPASFNYRGFNHTGKDTDFEYVRLESRWDGGWSTDGRLYTYYYNNQTISSTDPTGLTNPGTVVGGPGNKDIPGIDKQNKYRAYGAIVSAARQFEPGLLRVGAWYEYSDTDRHQYDIDLTLGNVRDPRETKPTPLRLPSVLFDQQSNIRTVQPFAEFEWELTPTTLVTPGVKYVSITRSVDAIVNQTTRLAQDTSVDFRTTLPFLTVNQRLGSDLAAYAQYAKGFQIPDLKSFYIADPSRNSSEPQLSTNYQVGIVGKSRDWVWDADLYLIDFKNKYVSNGQGGTNAAFVNLGGARYKGAEAQVTYLIQGGLALYANGSINRAVANDTGKTISSSPNMTAAAGIIYMGDPWGGSLIFKRTGSAYQQDFDPANPANYDYYKIGSYDNVDLGVSYAFRRPFGGVRLAKLQFNVFNLVDQQHVVAISPGKVHAGDQYIYQAPRSYQISARVEF